MTIYKNRQVPDRPLPSHKRAVRDIKIAPYGLGLLAAMFLITLTLFAPICSRADTPVPTVQTVLQPTPTIYIADADGNLVLMPNAWLAVQEGAVYTDAYLLGYLDPSDNTIIVDSAGNPIGVIDFAD